MKSEIKAFFVGLFVGLCSFIAFIFGRKKNSSDGNGIHNHNEPIADGLDTVERIQDRTESRLDEIESGLQESIDILHRARERMEEKNDSI